jgi:hypothetical protein
MNLVFLHEELLSAHGSFGGDRDRRINIITYWYGDGFGDLKPSYPQAVPQVNRVLAARVHGKRGCGATATADKAQ